MIDRQALEQFINNELKETDLFLTGLEVSADNRITVEVDSMQSVDIDECVALSRAIEANFDRDVEDYELEVGSAGITSDLKVPRQWEKNVGHEIEVYLADGRKIAGSLREAGAESYRLDVERKVRPEGAKRPVIQTESLELRYADTRRARPLLSF